MTRGPAMVRQTSASTAAMASPCGAAMSSWHDFEAAAPELAARGWS